MKYIILFALIALLTTFFSCKKDPVVPLPPPQEEEHIIELGRISFLRDGNPLSLPTEAVVTTIDNKRMLSLAARYKKQSINESLVIFDLPEKTGKVKMEFHTQQNKYDEIPSSLMAWIFEIDQGMGNINVDTTRSDNWLEVIHYDSIKQTLEGRFEVHMKNYFPTIYTGIPKKLDITDGKFYVRIK